MNGPEETRLARFTRWFRRRPTSLEFWELFVTDRRVVWCFAGESFASLLLRADTAERSRREIAELTPEEAMAFDERNFAVPLDSLRTLELREGSRFRRAALSLSWREDGTEASTSIDLYNTSAGDSQSDVVESLRERTPLSHVDVRVEATRKLF